MTGPAKGPIPLPGPRPLSIFFIAFFALPFLVHAAPISPKSAPKSDEGVVILTPEAGRIVTGEELDVRWEIKNPDLDKISFVKVRLNSATIRIFRVGEITRFGQITVHLEEGSQYLGIEITQFSGRVFYQDLAFEYRAARTEGMVKVPGGPFFMGSAEDDRAAGEDEKPRHQVVLRPYLIDRYEVNNAGYAECVADKACRPAKFNDAPKWNAPDKPVVGVSWEDARAYCRWKNARLPTEAEWERAAGGDASGPPPAEPQTRAWFLENSGARTWPTGQKKPNDLGIHDMAGNVWEWCRDWYAEDYYARSPRDNPEGFQWGDFRVLRGGAWSTPAKDLRSRLRLWWAPNKSSTSVGFRCARDDPKDPIDFRSNAE